MKAMPGSEQVGALIAARYRVEATLGQGGMAIVYRVQDERLGKPLALKRCAARDRRKLSRYGALLEREYHTLTQLAHPGIIEVYDYGVDPRGPYYTMELLEGGDLENVDCMPWQAVCVALRDVASALAILHSRGLLHRDVSVRNVRATLAGRTKLIDFGAMMTMGVTRDVVGTPSFTAPEALQLQALDARADLFSLGALGYRLLTGRHAFPARRFSQLRDAWRSKPAAPHLVQPEVPLELSTLILRLLNLDRSGRPHSAAEVIERLRVVANLEREADAEISQAYLTTPTLVGREAALVSVRQQTLSLMRGEGGAILVRGAAGSGRSRVLDACALEGKLLGATVIRADGRDASVGEWGVARALGNQLLLQFPKQAAEAARLAHNVLAHVLDDLRSDDSSTVTGYTPERSVIIRELRDWLLSLAKTQRMVIVVDDIEQIDDASLALLAALAHKADHQPILLAMSATDDPTEGLSPALRLVHAIAAAIELRDLTPLQTEALIRSLFGEVEHAATCAARIHALSNGNPGATMALAQHLVDTGRARYELGSWVLPSSLDESDLPATLSASLLSRLEALGEDARELADALALTDADAPLMASFPALTSYRDAKRVFRALDQLVAARILYADADRYYFAKRGFLAVLLEAMPEERRRGLHARIARFLTSTGGAPLRQAHHMLAAGIDADAIELLGRLDLAAEFPSVSLLTTAIARAQQLGVPANALHRLRMGVLLAAPYSMDYDSFRAVAPAVLERLVHDSGLAHYREMTDVPADTRLSAAMTRAHQVYLATPERERVHAPLEAIRELSRFYGALQSMAAPVFDLELLESLPSLEPLFPLSPTLRIISQTLEGAKEWVRGRHRASRDIYEAVLRRVAEPDRGGFDDVQHERVVLTLNFTVGLLEAYYGIPAFEERAKLIEKNRLLRVNAWRMRALFQLAIGDTAEANKCGRRAELLQAQDGLKERYVSSTTGMQVALRAALGDLIGVKGQMQVASSLAAQAPGWRPVEFLARSRYAELQGDLETALRLVEAGLEIAKPMRHSFCSGLAVSQVTQLADLGRLEEATALARERVVRCERDGLDTPDMGWRMALVLSRAGHHEEAATVLAAHIERAETLGRTGMAAGMLFEAQATIAIARKDTATFEAAILRCAREYEKSNNPALKLRLTRVIDQAREQNLVPGEVAISVRRSLEPPAPESEYETLHSRIAECIDLSDRGRVALTLLLQQADCSLGYLYGMNEERSIVLLSALPDAPLDHDLQRWVEQCALNWLTSVESLDGRTESLDLGTQTMAGDEEVSQTESQTATGSATADMPQDGDVSQAYTDLEGRQLEAIWLVDSAGDGQRLAAILVVESHARRPTYVSQALIANIARELLHYGDVSGWHAL